MKKHHENVHLIYSSSKSKRLNNSKSLCNSEESSNVKYICIENEDKGCHSKNSNIPRIIGYTCPDCQRTFKSFTLIAEHKVGSECVPFCQNISSHIVSNLRETEENEQEQNVDFDSRISSQLSLSPLFDLFSSVPICALSTSKIKDENLLELSQPLKHHRKRKLSFRNLTSDNVDFLKVHYNFNHFPPSKDIAAMAKRLSVERECVGHWFQKERSKERKGFMSVEYQPPRECQHCPSIFVHLEALKRHENDAHDPNSICIKFICPVDNCNAKFLNSTLLETHRLTHDDDSNKIAIKNREVNSRYDENFLEKHYAENNFPTPMEIGFIGRRLQLESLAIHWWFKERRAKHAVDIEKQMLQHRKQCNDKNCCTCSTTGKSKNISTTKECEVCDAAFLDAQHYRKHFDVHFTNNCLVCIECGAEYYNALALETHMYRHSILSKTGDLLLLSKTIKSSGEYKFTFLHVQIMMSHFKHNNFPSRNELKLIAKRLKTPIKYVIAWFAMQRSVPPTMANGKALAVNLCPFTLKSNSESSNINCSLCSSEFLTTNHIRTHVAAHKSNIQYICNTCQLVFLHKKLLETHSLSHFSGTKLKSRIRTQERYHKENCKSLIKSSIVNVNSEENANAPEEAQKNIEECTNADVGLKNISSLALNEGNSLSTNSLGNSSDIIQLKKSNFLSNEDKSTLLSDKNEANLKLNMDQMNEDSLSEDDELRLVIDE